MRGSCLEPIEVVRTRCDAAIANPSAVLSRAINSLAFHHALHGAQMPHSKGDSRFAISASARPIREPSRSIYFEMPKNWHQDVQTSYSTIDACRHLLSPIWCASCVLPSGACYKQHTPVPRPPASARSAWANSGHTSSAKRKKQKNETGKYYRMACA